MSLQLLLDQLPDAEKQWLRRTTFPGLDSRESPTYFCNYVWCWRQRSVLTLLELLDCLPDQ
jgi:hypothetical protein